MIDGVSLVILVEDDDDVDRVESVDNVDCNELSSNSEAVTISDSVVSIDD